MKRLLFVILAIGTAATPVLAAQTVYLKAGGSIAAKSVWRSQGRVHVLVNRDTLTDFSTAEIDLKRTFPRRHHRMKRATLSARLPEAAATAAAAAVSDSGQQAASRPARYALPALPALGGKNPESLVPADSNGGTIRKHKKEMAERLGE